MLHLALLYELFHRACNFFDGNLGIHAVLIQEVDLIRPQALQRGLGYFLDMFRSAVDATPSLSIGTRLESELGGDLYLLTYWLQGFTHQLLVYERTINFRRIEQRYAAIHSRADQRDHLLSVARRTI